jgi:hypothetical protein
MTFIEDFFLDKERIRKVLSDKIAGELHLDSAARQGLEHPSPVQTDAEKAVTKWMDRYRVLRLSTTVREKLVKAIIADASQIRRSLTAAEIIDRHAEIRTLCNTVEGIRIRDKNTGTEKDRNVTSLASKLLWLMHPETVPIFDSQSWWATTVIARISGKVYTPGSLVTSDLVLNQYCAFLKLHILCFGDLYATIGTIVAEEFSTIFANATRKNNANTEADAKRQYANHVTVIDQLLWHLGSEIAVDGCVSKRIRKKLEKKSPSSQAQKSLD